MPAFVNRFFKFSKIKRSLSLTNTTSSQPHQSSYEYVYVIVIVCFCSWNANNAKVSRCAWVRVPTHSLTHTVTHTLPHTLPIKHTPHHHNNSRMRYECVYIHSSEIRTKRKWTDDVVRMRASADLWRRSSCCCPGCCSSESRPRAVRYLCVRVREWVRVRVRDGCVWE